MIALEEIKKFLEEMNFIKVTDFAKTLKRRDKKGKLRK